MIKNLNHLSYFFSKRLIKSRPKRSSSRILQTRAGRDC